MEPQSSNSVEDLSAELKSVEPKFFLLSKTIWGIIILAVLVLSKWAGLDIDESAGNAADVFEKLGAILVVLGLRTKEQPLTFKTKLPAGAANLLLAMGMLCMAAVFVGGLSSCSSGSPVDVEGKIYYRDENSGAKGGLDFVSGEKPKVWWRVPVPDGGAFDLGNGFNAEISQPEQPEVDPAE